MDRRQPENRLSRARKWVESEPPLQRLTGAGEERTGWKGLTSGRWQPGRRPWVWGTRCGGSSYQEFLKIVR